MSDRQQVRLYGQLYLEELCELVGVCVVRLIYGPCLYDCLLSSLLSYTIHSEVELIQWLHGDTVVQSSGPTTDSSGTYGLFLISSEQMSLESSGQYFCKVRWTGGPFSSDVTAGTLTVLGQCTCTTL